MKKILLLVTFTVLSAAGFTQPPVVYFDFVTHDEDTGPWGNPTYYAADRAKLISLAKYFQKKWITLWFRL